MKKINLLLFVFFAFQLSAQDLQHLAPTTDVFNGGRGSCFNDGWKFNFGDIPTANTQLYNDAAWRDQTIPHDWGIEYPFNRNSAAGSDGAFLDGGIGWY
jgi:beta-galactosidase